MPACRYVYATCSLHPRLNVPQQAIAKLDLATGQVERWSRGERYYTGEPVFVPRASSNSSSGAGAEDSPQAAEDDGWLLSLCYDASSHSSELVVLDAQRISAGPVATLPLPLPVPHGLHGSWVPAADELSVDW